MLIFLIKMPKADVLVCPELFSTLHCPLSQFSFHQNWYTSLRPLILSPQSCLLRDGTCDRSSYRKDRVAVPLVLGSEWHEKHSPMLPQLLPEWFSKDQFCGLRKEMGIRTMVAGKNGTAGGSRAARKSRSHNLCAPPHGSFFLSCQTIGIMILVPTGAAPGQLITHQVIYFLTLSSTRTIILQVNRGASKSQTEPQSVGEQLIKRLHNLQLYCTSHPRGSPSARQTDVHAGTQPRYVIFIDSIASGGVCVECLLPLSSSYPRNCSHGSGGR